MHFGSKLEFLTRWAQAAIHRVAKVALCGTGFLNSSRASPPKCSGTLKSVHRFISRFCIFNKKLFMGKQFSKIFQDCKIVKFSDGPARFFVRCRLVPVRWTEFNWQGRVTVIHWLSKENRKLPDRPRIQPKRLWKSNRKTQNSPNSQTHEIRWGFCQETLRERASEKFWWLKVTHLFSSLKRPDDDFSCKPSRMANDRPGRTMCHLGLVETKANTFHLNCLVDNLET